MLEPLLSIIIAKATGTRHSKFCPTPRALQGLPPGEFNGVFPQPLPVYSETKTKLFPVLLLTNRPKHDYEVTNIEILNVPLALKISVLQVLNAIFRQFASVEEVVLNCSALNA